MVCVPTSPQGGQYVVKRPQAEILTGWLLASSSGGDSSGEIFRSWGLTGDLLGDAGRHHSTSGAGGLELHSAKRMLLRLLLHGMALWRLDLRVGGGIRIKRDLVTIRTLGWNGIARRSRQHGVRMLLESRIASGVGIHGQHQIVQPLLLLFTLLAPLFLG